MRPIIRVENLSKLYQVGAMGSRSIKEAAERWWHKVRGKEFPIKRPRLSEFDSSQQGPELNTFWALRDVSFEVQPGEIIGIIGRNGAGKSTLLKILSRITEPTLGRVILHGRVASLLEVGTGFHPDLTGHENIYLNGAILGMRKLEINKKFDEIVAFSEVGKFIDTPVKHYSSGMYVRLAFAVAAHLDPEILFIDEVLAVGDTAFQKKCLGKMDEVAKKGKTVLFVSHNMPMIQRLCKSTILLQRGTLNIFGASNYVIEEYLEEGIKKSLSWERADQPTRQDVYLKKVNLINEEGVNARVVTTANRVSVQIEFRIMRSNHGLQLSVELIDCGGEVLFESFPEDSGFVTPKEPGLYSAVMDIPPELFLPKTYSLRVFFWSFHVGIIDICDDLRFSVEQAASLANSVPGGRAGSVALRCVWNLAPLL